MPKKGKGKKDPKYYSFHAKEWKQLVKKPGPAKQPAIVKSIGGFPVKNNNALWDWNTLEDVKS